MASLILPNQPPKRLAQEPPTQLPQRAPKQLPLHRRVIRRRPRLHVQPPLCEPPPPRVALPQPLPAEAGGRMGEEGGGST